MKKEYKQVHVCMGLPGSGKTYYLKNIVKHPYYFDLDNVTAEEFNKAMEEISYTLWQVSIPSSSVGTYKGLCLDTLIVSNDGLIKFVNKVLEHCNFTNCELVIHRFKPNREICMYNDRGRRKLNSAIVIKNAEVEEFEVGKICSELYSRFGRIVFKEHDVVKKPDYKMLVTEENFNHKIDPSTNILKSKEWIIGGEWGSYTGDIECIDGEAEEEFTELDELLDLLAPNLYYRTYKKIKTIIEKTERTEYGYYSSRTTYMRHEINVAELYALLEAEGAIDKS